MYNKAGQHLGHGRYIGRGAKHYGASTCELVPVCSFIDRKNPGLGTRITWETYSQKSLNYNYTWTWIDEEDQFGWKQYLVNFEDDWEYTPPPDPTVTVLFSKGMKAKVRKLLKQNDD